MKMPWTRKNEYLQSLEQRLEVYQQQEWDERAQADAERLKAAYADMKGPIATAATAMHGVDQAAEQDEQKKEKLEQEQNAQAAVVEELRRRRIAKCVLINQAEDVAPVSAALLALPISFPTYALITESPEALTEHIRQRGHALIEERYASGEMYAVLSALSHAIMRSISQGLPVQESIGDDKIPAPDWFKVDVCRPEGASAEVAEEGDCPNPESDPEGEAPRTE